MICLNDTSQLKKYNYKSMASYSKLLFIISHFSQIFQESKTGNIIGRIKSFQNCTISLRLHFKNVVPTIKFKFRLT